jgi:predicted nuclease with TOPRIM domain
LKEEIATKTEEIATQKADIKSKAEEIATQKAEIASKSEEIATLEKAQAVLKTARDELEARVAALTDKLNEKNEERGERMSTFLLRKCGTNFLNPSNYS